MEGTTGQEDSDERCEQRESGRGDERGRKEGSCLAPMQPGSRKARKERRNAKEGCPTNGSCKKEMLCDTRLTIGEGVEVRRIATIRRAV